MKQQQVMDEIEKSIEDKRERIKVLEGSLGQILTSTQVLYILSIYPVKFDIINERLKCKINPSICMFLTNPSPNVFSKTSIPLKS